MSLFDTEPIVTVEDIQLFCKAELGKDLDKVIIKKDASLNLTGYRIPECIRVLLKFSNEKGDIEKGNNESYRKVFTGQRSSCM